ncbi:hypothetical protein [Bosea vestrisii]|uniref:Uncharacterized protein n=1 Tax=Bosea vestrisii TaxID=151416 RepID=A0ABW0HF43_9HYPH
MLVYSNSFALNPPGGVNDVIVQISTWVGGARKSYVDPFRLAAGIRDLRFDDGAALSSLATLNEHGDPVFPYHFSARLTHGQPGVPGRRWVTEIGIRQIAPEQEIQCSVLLKTDEISARVVDPIQVTRPRIVEFLLSRCHPVSATPGLSVVKLTEGNAAAFGQEIEVESRRHPIVQISCDREGRMPIAADRLQSVLIGLAQVVEVPPGANTYRIEEIIGRKYSCFGGAINIIFGYRKSESGGFCKTVLMRPDRLEELTEAGVAIQSEILAIITHHTNLPNSWRHISNDSVREAILRIRLQNSTAKIDSDADFAVYEALLSEASEQLANENRELDSSRLDIEAREARIDQITSENDRLKYTLSSMQASSDAIEPEEGISNALSEAIRAALEKKVSLEQALLIVSTIFKERLSVLPTAFSSARDSDRRGFQYGSKALEMLMDLAGGYWDDIAEGKGDQQARARFGRTGFAAKESEKLSSEGRKSRTFRFKDQDFLMEKHLKHGVKDSFAETLRIHFDWIAEEKVIVIGHCGKHLDF